jgi:hypothetical protein
MVRVLGFLGFRDSMFAGLREEGRGEGIDRRRAVVCGRPARRRNAASQGGGCRRLGLVQGGGVTIREVRGAWGGWGFEFTGVLQA